jgi:hypothetical protein
MSPIEIVTSLFFGLQTALTYAAIGVAVIAAIFIVYRVVRSRG